MKKKYLLLIVMVLMLVSCSQKERNTFDLVKLNQELSTLSEDKFDIANVLSSVEYEKENIFENLIDVYDYEYDKVNISKENVLNGIVRISESNAQMYMVFQPASGKEKNLVQEMKEYIRQRLLVVKNENDRKLLENALLEENDDFIALIVSKDNEEILRRIENSTTRLFGVLESVQDDHLYEYGLNINIVEEYAIQKPVMTSAKTFMIVKPKKGHKEDVQKALASYLKQQETIFLSIPSEEEFIKNAFVGEIGDYQIVIISKDNERVFEAIKTYYK